MTVLTGTFHDNEERSRMWGRGTACFHLSVVWNPKSIKLTEAERRMAVKNGEGREVGIFVDE